MLAGIEVVRRGATRSFSAATNLASALRPKQVVQKLDDYIVGQNDAKRAVAIAMRNRWRRLQLEDDLRNEVTPSNILMIGPTGCGKTEIARRIANLSQAPFVKVEATKFTEVGFVGKDIETIVKDLVENAIILEKKLFADSKKEQVEEASEQKIIDALLGENASDETRASFLEVLRSGDLDQKEIDVEIPPNFGQQPIDSQQGQINVNELVGRLQGGQKAEKKRMKVADARPVLIEIEMERLMEATDIIKEALKHTEDNGIVFIDEIDKIVNTSDHQGDASSEGVQRDLLPLLEGGTFTTKHGNVNTDHILFIASGAFHQCAPSDLLAELQGRLPIRVTLDGLTEEDMYRILTEPVTNLIRQQVELLNTEGIALDITEGAIREIARVAADVNKTVENIGARRLYTVIERITEDVQFEAPDLAKGEKVVIDEEDIKKHVEKFYNKQDLSKFIL